MACPLLLLTERCAYPGHPSLFLWCCCCAVDAVFQALCEGALANPDPDAEDDEGDFYFDEVSMAVLPGRDHAWVVVGGWHLRQQIRTLACSW